jgi:hypothetical protein
MNDNHEILQAKEIKFNETNFVREVGPKSWQPNLFAGPFLPITSNGDGNLPYKMDEIRGSTFVDHSQNLILI